MIGTIHVYDAKFSDLKWTQTPSKHQSNLLFKQTKQKPWQVYDKINL